MPYNFLPAKTNSESIGSTAKRWLKGWFKWLHMTEYMDINEMSAARAYDLVVRVVRESGALNFLVVDLFD